MEDVEEIANALRAANIPWEAYQRGKMITPEQLEMIRAYDKKDAFVMSTLLDRHGKEYAKLFLNFLKLLNKDETIQYVLTMIDDMLTANPERVKLFHSLSPQEGLPFAPLLKCLDRDNDYIMQVANKIITGIICSGASITDETLSVYLRWLLSKLRNSNPNQLEIAIQALMNLFLMPEIRIKFMEMNETVNRLTEVIRSNNHYQIQYQVMFCFWLLSFTKEIAEKLREWNIVPLIVETVKSSIKEKVVRVCLSTLRNLIEKAPDANSLAMSDNKVLSLCQTLSSRKWSDEDIVADLEYLIEELQKSKTQLTSFDEYAAEVRSGRLEWSPPHKTEAFWKQNAEKLNEKDYELIRILVRLLNTSTDSLILSVAANDIGEYARCHPRGKKILQQLGAKQRIMELMSAPDPTVRYHSLIAVQKFMVHNWEYLSKAS